MPKIQKTWDLHSDKKVWTSTYWPYANHSEEAGGNPEENLWADDGCLDKFDAVLTKRKKKVGAKTHELVPALNYLASPSRKSGYYIPKPTVRENNAEITTGVDFTGDGKLRRGVKRDFLDSFEGFGSNGKTDGKLDVSWWGSCDAVALAGMLFEEPKKSVTIDGVTFSPQDIKGLLVLTASSQAGRDNFVGERYNGAPDEVVLVGGDVIQGTIKNFSLEDFRSGSFKRFDDSFLYKDDIAKSVVLKEPNGKRRKIVPSKVEAIVREDMKSLSPALFHKTVKTWLRQNRPFAMDHDPGPHVWNDNFDGATIKKSKKAPRGVKVSKLNGHAGDVGDGTLSFYTCKLHKGAKVDKEYGYWIEKKGGKDVNSGWIDSQCPDDNPDFLWRTAPKNKSRFVRSKNQRNPFVLPKLVEEIYKKSITD